jgi:ketosteroid isomerase-like protein
VEGPMAATVDDAVDWPPRRYGRAVEASEAVLAANRRYYEAFEARDLDAMSDLWERSDRALCTHPGWATLEGWGAVAASFFALFQNGQQIQFVLTRERVTVAGGTAWVSLDENLLGDQGGVTVATINIFVTAPESGVWRMICHHGSVVQVSSHQLSQ